VFDSNMTSFLINNSNTRIAGKSIDFIPESFMYLDIYDRRICKTINSFFITYLGPGDSMS